MHYRVHRARQLPLCCARYLQVITSCLISSRSILILASLLRIFLPSGAFAVGIPGKDLCTYFLTAMRVTNSAHIFSDTTKCTVRHPRHRLIVFRIFRLQLLLHLQREKLRHYDVLKNKTPIFSRKFCNELPSNAPSYNRRKGGLFIPPWKLKS